MPSSILAELNRLGAELFADYDAEQIARLAIEGAVRLTGAAHGYLFFAQRENDGRSSIRHQSAGAPADALADMLPAIETVAALGPLFAGTSSVRSDDIQADPRFDPDHARAMTPNGQPAVTSCLATPLRSPAGEFLGGIVLGHHERGTFDFGAQQIAESVALKTAVALDKARVHDALMRIERELDHKVRVRTAELAAANASLIREIEERQRVEGSFQHLVEGVTDYALFMLEPDGTIANWNTGAERIKGYRASEIVGRNFAQFYTEEDRAAGVPARALETARRDGKFEAEGQRVRKDGSRFWASVVINRINDRNGNLLGFAKITRDITERKQTQDNLQLAQEQLVQSQKIEGIGQLTGGVAHDFNNLLTVILGNLESAQRISREDAPDRERLLGALDHAVQGAQRAASLTQRLLAFSRRSPLDPKPIDANRLVTNMSDLLRRTLGEQIAIETVLGGNLWRTLADPNQLEVGILNLAVNARDAMPNGGRLTIETANSHLDESHAVFQPDIKPGEYIVISITDTGVGMDRETLARACEPFFTTKDVGHGTGLGLSQVFGFAKQSGGQLRIQSEVDHGTTVKLYLPRLQASEEPDALPPSTPTQAPFSRASETILVVEDDRDVRINTTGMLRELRYNVLDSSMAAGALHLLETHPEIDLLFTDVGLPGGMNGRQLADVAQRIRPDLKVLFTSGYARDAIVHRGRLDPGIQFLAKPFTYAGLASKIAQSLKEGESVTEGKRELRVLLVEDDVLVRMLAQQQLASLGCKVETAASIEQAMEKVKELGGSLDVAVIDIGLPDGKGDKLAAELRALYPRLPIVIASGYDDESMRRLFKGDANIRFIGKPYLLDDLKQAVGK